MLLRPNVFEQTLVLSRVLMRQNVIVNVGHGGNLTAYTVINYRATSHGWDRFFFFFPLKSALVLLNTGVCLCVFVFIVCFFVFF